MNGSELVDEVLDIVSDPSITRDKALGMLNRGMSYVAGQVLLPGLATGVGRVTTSIGQNSSPLPADYQREIFWARVAGEPVAIYANLGVMLADGFSLELQAGRVLAIVPNGGDLIYQLTPTEPTDIDIRYYRLPIPMQDKRSSMPDGLGNSPGMIDAYDQTLIHYGCWRLYERIEQGLEGGKVDSQYHEGQCRAELIKLEAAVRKERPRQPPPVCEVRY
ncbi:MAG: hypothetical protein ACK5PS_08935 [Desulfopila sp.]